MQHAGQRKMVHALGRTPWCEQVGMVAKHASMGDHFLLRSSSSDSNNWSIIDNPINQYVTDRDVDIYSWLGCNCKLSPLGDVLGRLVETKEEMGSPLRIQSLCLLLEGGPRESN